jgi:uncharacterized protein (TIGR02001 family)
MLPGVAPAAEESPHTLTGNVGLYSQYIFRGLNQTGGNPALQGGFDYSHSSGFYAGTWASNISWLKENASAFGPPIVEQGTYGRGGSLEWDFYGGYKWGFAPDWTLDLGTLYYWYPGKISNNPAINPAIAALTGVASVGVPKADTWELYAGLAWKWLSAKYSYSLQNETFGVLDSSGTWYLDFSANFPLTKELALVAHYGIQKYSGTDPRNVVVGGLQLDNDNYYSYEDWKIGLTYALPKDFTIGAYYTDTSGANVLGYGSYNDIGAGNNRGVFPRSISKGTGTVFISKTF